MSVKFPNNRVTSKSPMEEIAITYPLFLKNLVPFFFDVEFLYQIGFFNKFLNFDVSRSFAVMDLDFFSSRHTTISSYFLCCVTQCGNTGHLLRSNTSYLLRCIGKIRRSRPASSTIKNTNSISGKKSMESFYFYSVKNV